MGLIEPGHLILILLIALILLGPGRIGDLGGQLGRSVREFRDASEGQAPTTPDAPALGAGMYCTSCGHALPREAKFCTSCGKPVAGAA